MEEGRTGCWRQSSTLHPVESLRSVNWRADVLFSFGKLKVIADLALQLQKSDKERQTVISSVAE